MKTLSKVDLVSKSALKGRYFFPLFALLILSALAPDGQLWAQTAHDDSAQRHGSHDEHRHHLALFLGGTYGEVNTHGSDDHSEGEPEKQHVFAIGADYQYKIIPQWLGIGGVFDYAGGDIRSTVIAPAAFIQPVGGFQIALAPGVEHTKGHNSFLFRLGFYYEFEFGRYSVAPNFDIDFVGSERTYVYGLAIGVGF